VKDAIIAGDPITLRAVRRWAIRRGATPSEFLSAYRRSLTLSVSRLAQAVYRERLCVAQVIEHPLLGTSLTLGGSGSLLIPIVPKAFVRLESPGWPCCYRSNLSPLKWSGTFLRELGRALRDSPVSTRLKELKFDFQNSLSNLILNLFLGMQPSVTRRALEPAYQGHHYYPFPALRVGPSIQQVVACSHLNTKAIAVSLLEVSALTFRSTVFSSPGDCFSAWANLKIGVAEHAIPVHPWQLGISPVIDGILSANGARVLRTKVRCMPLASQRTFRVQSTSYDIKLSVNAAVTSEHRLLYRLNCENAPAVSALVGRLLSSRVVGLDFDIQADLASLSFGDARVAPHLSAIVRAPIRVAAREHTVPAIDLWTGRETAGIFLRDAKVEEVNRFFRSYCQVMLRGPLSFLLRFGLAFEPHLQNSVIVFRGGKPARLILRDLDGTLMDRNRVGKSLGTFNLSVAADTWDHMPDFGVGESRLVHSLFLGHLAEVLDFLAARCGAHGGELLAILGEEWRRLPEVLRLRAAGDRFDALCEHFEKGKRMLVGRLERSTDMRFVDLPRHAPFPEESRFFHATIRWHHPSPSTPIRVSEPAPSD
jgi:hypothetical protein